MKNKTHILYVIFLLIFSCLLTLFWFREGKIMAAAESGIPFYNFKSDYQNTHLAWNEYIVGGPSVYTIATNPSYFLLLKLNDFGVSSLNLEIGFFTLCIFMAALGVFLLLKILFPNSSYLVIFISTLFYLANPISQANVWNRFLYNHTLFFCSLPIFIYMFWKGTINKNFKFSFYTSIFSVIISYAISAPAFLVVLWICFSLIALLNIFFLKDKFFIIKYFLLTLFLFLVFNSWWISQVVAGYFLQFRIAQDTQLFTASGNLDALQSLSARLGNLRDIARFAHASVSKNNFLDNLIGYSFFIAITVEVTKFIKFREQKNYLVVLLFLVSIIFMMGSNPPFGGLYSFLFNKIVLFQFLRNPFEKFSFVFSLSSALLLGSFSQSLVKRKILFIVIISLFLFWGRDFFLGSVFSVKEKGENINYSISVPDDYEIANNILKDSESRVFALPFTEEGILTSWQDKYLGVEPYRDLLDVPAISLNTSIPFYSQIAKYIFGQQRSTEVLDFFPYFDTNYLILRHDLDYKSRGLPSTTDLNFLIRNMNKKHDGDILDIYDVPQEYQWGRFYISNRFIYSNSYNLSKVSSFDKAFPKSKNVVLNIDSLSKNNIDQNSEEIIIFPLKNFIPQIPGLRDGFSDEELINNLVYVKHLPNSKIYPFLLLKEYLERPNKDRLSERKKYDIDILGKRAVEYYNLNRENRNAKTIQESKNRYLSQLKIVSQYNYLDSISIDSILYQYSLLGRIDSTLASQLAKYIESLNLKPINDLPKIENNLQYSVYQFEIPRESNYFVDSILWAYSNKVYINGEEIKKESNILKLNSGFNEISLQVPESSLESIVYREPEINTSNFSNYIKTIQIDSTKSYKIKFDYRFSEGNRFILQIKQDIDKEGYPVFRRVIDKNAFFHNELSYEATIKPSIGANNITIEILPDSEKENSNFKLLITNLYLNREVDKELILSTGNIENHISSSDKVEWQKVDSTRYKLKVNKITDQPSVIVFSELYDAGWEIKDLKHIKVNGYANGWLINKSGNYELEAVYKPQKYLDIFTLVTILSVLFSTIYLLFKK